MIKTIDECFFLIQNGANIKQGDTDGGFPITRIETTANDKFNRDRMGYAGITDISKYESYVLEDGDLLLSHINSVQYLGRTVLYVKQPGETIIHGMNLLRLKARRNVINPAYARYCFYGHPFRSQVGNITKKSVNQASFAVKDLKQIKIDIPTVSEQNEIVMILDKVQQVIDLRTDELSRLDDLIKARFVELFGDMIINPNGWEKILLGDVCDVRDGTHDSPKYFSEGYPLVTSKNVTGGKIDFADCNLICEEDYNKINQRSKVDMGDILMPMIGTVGNPVIVDIEAEFAIKNVALIKFKEDSKVTNSFVKALLESDYFDRAVISKVRGGTQKFISLGDIRKLEICLPPIAVQNLFAAFVQQVDKSKVAVKKALNEAQLLFDSLMQKYFS